jgi:hypothetical protein
MLSRFRYKFKIKLPASIQVEEYDDKLRFIGSKDDIYELPAGAWDIMASKFMDVLEGYDDNPFDFNDTHKLVDYLNMVEDKKLTTLFKTPNE